MKNLVTKDYLESQRKFWHKVVQTARLCCGMPDYDNYVRHVLEKHPGQIPMDYATFFKNRLDARYGGKDSGFRCC